MEPCPRSGRSGALCLCLMLGAGAARSQELDAPAPPVPESAMNVPELRRPGWVSMPSSIVLYDSSGTPAGEIASGQWDEEIGTATVRRRTVRSGASEDGRFAWDWQKVDILQLGRVAITKSTGRFMRYLGTDGQELWRDELADAPKGVDPVAISKNGETALVLERTEASWGVAAFSFAGNKLLEVRGSGGPRALALSPNGRYGLVLWHPLDQPPLYSFLDLGKRRHVDKPADPLSPGAPRMADDGKAYVGNKTAFSFP